MDTNIPAQRYYLKNRLLFLWLSIVVFFAVSFLLFFDRSWLLIGIYTFLGLQFFALAQLLWIDISPEGIRYSNMGIYTITASWTQATTLHTLSVMDERTPCLVAPNAVCSGWAGLALGLPKHLRRCTIPLSSGWARAEQLNEHIQHYQR